jgi:hypothetical protein
MARRSGQRGGAPDPAAVYMGAMQTSPTAAVGGAIRDFIYGLITDGYWPAFECFWLCNLGTEQASRLNAVDARYCTLTDSVAAPTWATGVAGAGGFTAASGSRLDTGWSLERRLGLPIRHRASRDNICLLYRSWTTGTSSTVDFGDASRFISALKNASGTSARIFDGTTETMGVPADGVGLFGYERNGNADKRVYLDGSSQGSTATAGVAGSSSNTIHLLGNNGASPGARRMSFAAIGAAIGAAGHAAVAARLSAFETAIGAS